MSHRITITANTATIRLHGDVGYDIDAESLAADIEALDVEQITVRINSGGGVVWDGFAIYNALVSHKARVEVIVEGLAASMASVMAMAGDTVHVLPQAVLMIHNPWVPASGDAAEHRRVADMLDAMAEAVASAYIDRTGIPAATVRRWMDAETWFTASEAVEAGLVDGILEESATVAAHFDLDVFSNVPADVRARYAGKPRGIDLRGFLTGNDPEPATRVAALWRGFSEDPTMTTANKNVATEPVAANTPTDPIAATREREAADSERIRSIRALCNGRTDDIEARAIRDGWSVLQAENAVLRADRPRPPAGHIADATGGCSATDAITANILCRLGKEKLAVEACGGRAVEFGRKRFSHAMDVCGYALSAEARDIPHARPDMVRASLSTVSLPTALGNVANKILIDAYRESPQTWRPFAAIKSVANFHQATGVRPTFTGQMEQVAPGGELKHGSVTEALFNWKVNTFGKILRITREHIINDDLGIYSDTAVAYGRMAARGVNDLVYETLLANAGSFFSEGNGNLLAGETSPLCIDSVTAAITKMRTQRDREGNDLDLTPRTLAVPPELETLARQIIASAFIQRATDDAGPTGNALQKIADLVVESRLSNTTKFANASDTAWFLFASPIDMPMVVAFLNGVETPTVEFFGLDQDINTLSVGWRVYFDYGAALGDHRGAVRSDGE